MGPFPALDRNLIASVDRGKGFVVTQEKMKLQ